MHNVEDALEILSGVVPRTINIRIDQSDKSLINSLGRQVHKGMALTDRQLDLSLTKVLKYRDGLTANGIDVDRVLQEIPLRMPLREVDRSQKIYLSEKTDVEDQRIYVKYIFSKKIEEVWTVLKPEIEGEILFGKNLRSVLPTELNLYKVVNTFKPLGFEIDPKVEEIYEKVDEILKNPQNYVPQVDIENENFVVRNVSSVVSKLVDEKFPEVNDNNFVDYITFLKRLEIFHKNPKITEKIENLGFDQLSTSVLKTPHNKILLNSEKYKIEDAVSVIENLNQWPVLIILEEKPNIFQTVKDLYNIVKDKVDPDAITVFFRLSKGQNNAEEFNQFVKDHHLNNYIDEKTKVVFITKERIPKPLIKSAWKPLTALVLTSYDYGRIGSYINSFKTVYYYSNSIVVQTLSNRSRFLVEL